VSDHLELGRAEQKEDTGARGTPSSYFTGAMICGAGKVAPVVFARGKPPSVRIMMELKRTVGIDTVFFADLASTVCGPSSEGKVFIVAISLRIWNTNSIHLVFPCEG
jgi:hypothetical protein